MNYSTILHINLVKDFYISFVRVLFILRPHKYLHLMEFKLYLVILHSFIYNLPSVSRFKLLNFLLYSKWYAYISLLNYFLMLWNLESNIRDIKQFREECIIKYRVNRLFNVKFSTCTFTYIYIFYIHENELKSIYKYK